MKCWYCKKTILKSHNFCRFCGKSQEGYVQNFTFGGLFEGRIGRGDYWIGNFISNLLLGICFAIYESNDFIILIVSLIWILILLSIAIRRAHDLGWSGWRLILLCVPLANLFISIALAFSAGSNEENAYGEREENHSSTQQLRRIFLGY